MKRIFLTGVFCLSLTIFAACGKTDDSEAVRPTLRPIDLSNVSDDANEGADSQKDSSSMDLGSDAEGGAAQSAEAEKLREMFGEACIADQTFEVELSEYSGKVYFVPLAPSKEDEDLAIQIVQNGQVLADIRCYVPEALAQEKFTSLDAVSFYDVNFDGFTDIVLIETYGSTSFAAVYYGFDAKEEYLRYFFSQDQLSENITAQADVLTIPGIRSFLTGGKKNGEFGSYQEAYRVVSRLCQLENGSEIEYDLIDFDGDDIPELVAGVEGYYVSLYTYHDGKIYTLMDSWAYGAMGNAGYEYCPAKNSLRNYNSDYAGAVLYTTYMTIGDKYSLDMVVQIVLYNFDDANGNGVPDESEMGSVGMCGVSYIGGVQVTPEECASYDQGEYIYITPSMSLKELTAALS